MNKTDVKNSFRKVLLAFDADRARQNSMRLFVAGIFSIAFVVTFFIYTSSYFALSLIILPVGIFWKSIELFLKSRNSAGMLRDVNNVEIRDELRKFSAKGFKKTI